MKISNHLGVIRRELLDHVANHAQVVKPTLEPLFMSSSMFSRAKFPIEWLVEDILVKGQAAIVGGPKKSLKTNMLIDLAISLGTGTPFLGKFQVPHRVHVGIMSGESGQATIQETAKRTCRARGVDLCDASVEWGFRLPKLSNDNDLKELGVEIRRRQLGAIFIDPLYLSLLVGGSEAQTNPANLFAMGPLLDKINRTCLVAGATPLLSHHTTKSSGKVSRGSGRPLDLGDLAFAGVQEFARQWILLSRRQKFVPGSGMHHLYLNVGGSTGFSGCWAVEIDEGTVRKDFSGRTWIVTVKPWKETLGERQNNGENRAGTVEDDPDVEKVLAAFADHQDCQTQRGLAEHTGLSRQRVKKALQELLKGNRVEECTAMKEGGTGKHSYPGYILKS